MVILLNLVYKISCVGRNECVRNFVRNVRYIVNNSFFILSPQKLILKTNCLHSCFCLMWCQKQYSCTNTRNLEYLSKFRYITRSMNTVDLVS